MKKIPVYLLLPLLFVGCSGVKVTSDYDGDVDFASLKTYSYYGWAEESDKILNRFDKERIEKSFGEEFSKRGMSYVEEGGDLVVVLFIVVEQKTQKTANTTSTGGYGGYYGYGPGYGWGGGYSTTTISEYDYEVGTLVCDVFHAEDQKLIWEGIGTGTINENPAKREKSIPYAVKLIMAKYPVQPIPTK